MAASCLSETAVSPGGLAAPTVPVPLWVCRLAATITAAAAPTATSPISASQPGWRIRNGSRRRARGEMVRMTLVASPVEPPARAVSSASTSSRSAISSWTLA